MPKTSHINTSPHCKGEKGPSKDYIHKQRREAEWRILYFISNFYYCFFSGEGDPAKGKHWPWNGFGQPEWLRGEHQEHVQVCRLIPGVWKLFNEIDGVMCCVCLNVLLRKRSNW